MANWYITAKAVREWQAIHTRTTFGDRPAFDDAERSLLRLVDACNEDEHLWIDEGGRSIWRIKCDIFYWRRTMIYLTVSHGRRADGTLDQLVAVRGRTRTSWIASSRWPAMVWR